MYTYSFPRPAVTVDVVILRLREKGLQVLLIQRANEPYSRMWALPGGFLNMEETLEEAAYRELEEETGLKHAYLEQLNTYGDPGRDPRGRVISVAYFALVSDDTRINSEGGSDAIKAAWYPIKELPKLAFDHTEIVADALNRLRYKLAHTAAGFELLPKEFTLGELQNIFETIFDESLDECTFRQRILAAEIIESTHESRIVKGRPAPLYRYHADAISKVKSYRYHP